MSTSELRRRVHYMSAGLHLPAEDTFGLRAIIAGMDELTSGHRVLGPCRPMGALTGCRGTGLTGAVGTYSWKDTGAKKRLLFRRLFFHDVNHPGRESNGDPCLREPLLDPPVHLAPHGPLFSG